MKCIRFTIASLLIVVLFVAVGFTALRESNDLWDSGILTVTLAALPVSILLAVHRTESRQAFWLGFSLFGWIYLVLSLVPSIESRLLTTKGLAYPDSNVLERSSRVYDALRQLAGIRSGSPDNQFQSLTFNADGTQFATSITRQSDDLGCGDRQGPRWSERHDREFREDRPLAVRPAGGLVWRADLSPSLEHFQSARAISGGQCGRDLPVINFCLRTDIILLTHNHSGGSS